jgi:hypothetical protein
MDYVRVYNVLERYMLDIWVCWYRWLKFYQEGVWEGNDWMGNVRGLLFWFFCVRKAMVWVFLLLD